MLMRLSIFAAGIALVAMVLPGVATTYLERADTVSREASRPKATSAASYAGGKGVTIEATQGHFFGTFEINGRKQSGLIDTGASVIAINVSMSRSLGIAPGSLQYNARASTANGIVKAASVVLDRVKIGTISVDNVQAMVLPDASLSGMLVGMSFLNRLSSYRVENGALHLVN
ncbi:aspartyl protease family protein [Pararhizobium capsulatum DSM 1112]|uniref:Aspartyl protease family protein n=1 Tax=Pararhizobium capsulatum DSM 1112 TaxID=1121113 RepID=A0ABU0BKW8_9HYPH|nr:TIGR02281 family clan AA aspartic protease [Pararhizobium capsulatum]MDQ0318548.1 aspartyl protease family protein [Pararhizobium capsulatum DSM 1112]